MQPRDLAAYPVADPSTGGLRSQAFQSPKPKSGPSFAIAPASDITQLGPAPDISDKPRLLPLSPVPRPSTGLPAPEAPAARRPTPPWSALGPILKALSWLGRHAEVPALQPLLQASLIRAFLTQPTTDRKEALPLPMAVVVEWERYICSPHCPALLRRPSVSLTWRPKVWGPTADPPQ